MIIDLYFIKYGHTACSIHKIYQRIYPKFKDMPFYDNNNSSMSVYFICLLLLLSRAQVRSIVYSAVAPEIGLHGRSYAQNSAVYYDWTCFKIDFCFQASTKVYWMVEDTWNIYHIIIDDNTTHKVQPNKNSQILIFQSDLPESHCIDIIKITENHYGPYSSYKDSKFAGIRIEGGRLVPRERKYQMRFEFLGDSITTAYGVMSNRNPICFFYMKQIQNCLQNWAVHISNMFNAEYRIEAVSGRGVVRNMVGVPGKKMPTLFTRLSDNAAAFSYKFSDNYQPDVLFVFIGQNDYYNLYHPSAARFIKGYKDMLQMILQQEYKYMEQETVLINVCDIEYSRELCRNVKTAVKDFSFGYQTTYYVEIPEGTLPKENMGCIRHPNAKGQKKIAEALYPQIKQILNINKKKRKSL